MPRSKKKRDAVSRIVRSMHKNRGVGAVGIVSHPQQAENFQVGEIVGNGNYQTGDVVAVRSEVVRQMKAGREAPKTSIGPSREQLIRDVLRDDRVASFKTRFRFNMVRLTSHPDVMMLTWDEAAALYERIEMLEGQI